MGGINAGGRLHTHTPFVAFEKPFGQIESGERKWQAKPLKLILLAAI
jgi:hypothetical protein